MRELIENSDIENLVLFRHGKAQNLHDADSDFDRKLTETGKKEANAQGQRLKNSGFVPDVVLVSSAARAIETWEQVKDYFPNAEVVVKDKLYLASCRTYLKKATTCGAKNVMIIAHDPGLHELSRYFVLGGKHLLPEDMHGDVAMLVFDFPTAGIAWFKRDINAPIQMTLKQYFKTIPIAD